MTAEQFAYWMQGFAELTGDTPPTEAQWKSMREHLQTLFVKVTPPVGLPQPLKDWLPGFAAQRQGAPLRSECSSTMTEARGCTL